MIPEQKIEVVIKQKSIFVKYGFDPVDFEKLSGTAVVIPWQRLPLSSNKMVNVVCDECHVLYNIRYGHVSRKEVHHCITCHKRLRMKGNKFGKANKNKKALSGDQHPRWNPNKSEFLKYSRRVHWLTKKTYQEFKDLINPQNYPRTLCGVSGGYQLDHKMSIHEGFIKNVPPDMLADPSNLQMLPWIENRKKHKRPFSRD